MAETQPSGGSTVPFPMPDAAVSPQAGAQPTVNPPDSPYSPLNLPSVDPGRGARAAKSLSPEEPIQNLGAVSHGGAVAYLADKVLRGVVQGIGAQQQQKIDQYNKKLGAQQSIYNDQAKQLYDLAKSGADPNSPEYKAAYNRTLTSWQAMMDSVGQRVQPDGKAKKGKKGDNSDDALAAVYRGAQAAGPPVFHQVQPFLSPDYRSKQQQSAQTGDNQSATAVSASHAGLTTAQMQDELQTLQAKKEPTDADKGRITQLRESLSPIPKAAVDKPITRPDIQTVKLKSGQDVSAQWDGKKWTYLNGQPIPETDLGPEAKVAQKTSASQWSQGLNAYATSHKADPNDWQTIRSYEQEQYSAKNPLAERRLSITQRNSDIAAANLALRQSQNDWKDTQDIFKNLGPDIKIQATAKAADDYTSHPTGPGDAALTLAFFEAAKAADPGSGSGIRFTKQEQDLIQHARGFADAAQANVERFGKGTLYDDNQRQQMADIIKTAAKRSNETTANYIGAATKLNPKAAAAATGGASDTGKFTVTDPKGKVHPFDTQEQADHFKKLAGIK